MLPERHPLDRLEPRLSNLDATMLVVSSVIGVGIFLTPGAVAEALPSPWAFLAAWAFGGLLSLAGALATAELGAMYPHAGGDYVYLREAFHPLAGFVVGWVTFFAVYAGTVATLAVGFAEALGAFVDLSPAGGTAAAVAITLAASWVNFRGVRLGALVNTASGIAKVAALVALAVAAPLAGHFPGMATTGSGDGPITVGAFALAMSPVLFSYLGWNASIYVASEIRDPARNVPRSLLQGLAVSTAVYVVVNLAYLAAIPIDAMRGEVRVGEAAARALLGDAGAAVAAALILVSIVSCLNATILVGPRVAYAMAIDGLFFRAARSIHAKYATPHAAIAVQAATAIVLILVLGRFPRVLDYTTFAIVLATMADTAALYVLRLRRPHAPRPYRAWGYPVVPALYLTANAAIAGAMLAGRPLECAAALAVAASAVPAYAFFVRRSRPVA